MRDVVKAVMASRTCSCCYVLRESAAVCSLCYRGGTEGAQGRVLQVSKGYLNLGASNALDLLTDLATKAESELRIESRKLS